MATSSVEEQLINAEITYDKHILSDLNSLINDLNIDAEDFENELLAYKMNNDTASLNQATFKQLALILRTKSAKICKKTRSRSNSQNPPNPTVIYDQKSLKPLLETRATPNTNNAKSGDLMDTFLSMTTPSKAVKKKSFHTNPIQSTQSRIIPSPLEAPQPNILQTPISAQSAYKTRKRRGGNIDTLNENLSKNNNITQITVDIPHQNEPVQAKQYRFMNENIFSKQNAIKDRISFIGQCLMEQIQREQPQATAMEIDEEKDTENESAAHEIIYSMIDEPSQRPSFYLGRIINDGDSAYSGSSSDKITAGNMVLQDEFGKTVRLDTSSLKSLSLFPGQIVAVQGVNSSGKEINVSKIYQNAFIKEKVNTFTSRRTDNDGVLQMMIGCGPFTTQNSIDFLGSPFHDFAQMVHQKQPNVVILMGPFTDSQNERIQKNDIDYTLSELFEHLLTSFIASIPNGIKVIVCPSSRDVHHFTAFPQQRYTFEAMSARSNVYLVSNPSQFRINNVSIGICAEDFLFDCCRIGLTENVKDRLLSIMTHCIDQQHFYPLQPPSISLRMDYTKPEDLYMKDKLDLFVMPSKLKQFAKIYGKTGAVCINPSFLTRSNSGGSYALLNIHQSNDCNVTDYSELIRVDLLRI